MFLQVSYNPVLYAERFRHLGVFSSLYWFATHMPLPAIVTMVTAVFLCLVLRGKMDVSDDNCGHVDCRISMHGINHIKLISVLGTW
jgi:hypothetical protein